MPELARFHGIVIRMHYTELDDVAEVLSCAAALEHGLRSMDDGFPLSNRLVREAHAILMSGKRGISKQPCEFRASQNWIGGTRPGNARFVSPPAIAVPDCMATLERFIHARGDGIHPIIRAPSPISSLGHPPISWRKWQIG